MIGDIFYFEDDVYALLSDITDDSYIFLTVETDRWPRTFQTPKDQPLIKRPVYSFFACNHNEKQPEHFNPGDVVYALRDSTITAHKFITNVNPDGYNYCRLEDKNGIKRNIMWVYTMCFKHRFKTIEGTNAERCEDCGCLLTQQYKPRNKVPLSSGHDTQLPLQPMQPSDI